MKNHLKIIKVIISQKLSNYNFESDKKFAFIKDKFSLDNLK